MVIPREAGDHLVILGEQLQWMVKRNFSLHTAQRMFTVAYALSALDEAKGNISRAAELIGTHRNTLARVVKDHVQHVPKRRALEMLAEGRI